ncbi:hypothetical protein WDW89_05545 [Deltaproteobacteria bacterium TL4]
MFPLIENIYQTLPFDFFTDTELLRLIPGSDASRHGIIKRALAKKDLIRIRRGLYCLGESWKRKPLNLFALAHRCYGPSYISIESALSFHGLIPEAVYTITSVCLKRSIEFHSPIGIFAFTGHSRFTMKGVERILMETFPVLMATPAKAILDYVQVYKKDWTTIEPLIKSLRVDEEDLSQIPFDDFSELLPFYKNQCIHRLVHSLQKELT